MEARVEVVIISPYFFIVLNFYVSLRYNLFVYMCAYARDAVCWRRKHITLTWMRRCILRMAALAGTVTKMKKMDSSMFLCRISYDRIFL